MADNRKLAAGILNLPASARQELAQRAQDMEREGVVGMLRKAGKEMYENPIVNTAIGLTPVLGDVQAAGETMAALNRGAPWQETAGYAAGMLPFIPMIGKTVWHGSPHTFDKFDLSKIGTGEGAQAYGHGLYLAESPGTARSYQESLSTGPERFLVNGEEVLRREAKGPMLDVSDPKTAAIVYAAREGDKGARKYFKMQGGWGEKAIAELDAMKGQQITNELPGSLYKVDLPDEHIAKMLDWDKPLSQQSEAVRQAAQELGVDMEKAYGGIGGSGENLYKAAGMQFESPSQASAWLNERGILGIQYLDQASRGAGEGTRNYVVFSDEIPQILERNGQPVAQALREYRGSHTAPGPEFGAQLHDVTGGGAMYPEDIYSSRGASIYGHGGSDIGMDKETMRIIQQMRNKPEEMVDIYRAVPNETDISTINPGDWVTINPNYAKQHGESNLPEGYKILQQKVPAKSVWTNADSIHEYGYWPE